MRSARARALSRLSIIPAVSLAIAGITGSLAPAAHAATVRPSAPAGQAARAGLAAPAAPNWRAASAGADGPVAPPLRAGTVTNPPSIPVGSGPIANGTFRTFSISDKVSLRVNVGSGDALLTSSDIAVPEISSTLTLGVSYNSLLVGSGVAQGADGYGWRQREGVDVQLYPASSDGSVTLVGEDGTAGKFTAPASGSNTYGSPAVFHATLTNAPDSSCQGSAYELRWHQSGAAMCFNSTGLITSEVDRNGNTTTYNYCGCGHESSVTYTPKGASSPTRTVNATYTNSYLTGLSQSGGAAGTKNVTYNVNSTTGNLTSLTQADGMVVQFGYDSSHDLTSIQNYAGNTTTLTYNSAHQVTSVSQSAGSGRTATTRFDYVSSTETQVADPNTSQSQTVPNVPNITYTINSAALVTTTVDQGGNTQLASFNNGNNLTGTTGAITGENASYTYTPKGGESLINATSPTGAMSTWTYNNSPTGANPTANFQPSSSKDAQSNASAYTYDGPGNLQINQNALAAKAQVHYNSDGTPTTSTAPAGGVTSYGYTDGNHELNKITPPSGGSLRPVTITYDGFGRVSTVTDGDGNTVTYTYDLADRILKAAYTGGSLPVTVTYTYDGAGNTKTQADATGTVTWTYDPRNIMLTRTSTAGGGTLSYGYDLDGNMTSAQDANGTTSYVYDVRNLLTQMTDPAGHLWQFAYDADGRRTKTWFDTNSGETTWAGKMVTSYDASGHISQIVAYENTNYSDVVFNTSYCYSTYVSGQSCGTSSTSTHTALLQYSTNNITGTVSQYSYDKGNRLTKATNITGKTFSYGYDSNGNTTSGAFAGSLSYNADNQISSSGYSYDGAGNMTADNRNGTLTYNDAEQLVSASSVDGNGTEHFSYAGTGMSQLLSDGTASGITYGLDGSDGQPWVQSYTNGISPTAIYVLHDQQGTPLGMEHNGNDYFFITDNLGSVVDLIDTSGTTAATYNWDPYGHLISQSGGEENYNLTRYTGGLADMAFSVGTGLPGSDDTHLGDRWLDPRLGAFGQQDPQTVLDDPFNANSYAYAADNPVNNIDPTGHNPTGGDYAMGCLQGAVLGLSIGAWGGLVTGIVGVIGGCVEGLIGVGVASAYSAQTADYLNFIFPVQDAVFG